MKKISIACDHAGLGLKNEVIKHLQKLGMDASDKGCFSDQSVDYPDFAALVAKDLQKNVVEAGILICGTGIGMAITANKFKGIRAASLTDVFSTQMARKHNNLNVLCLGARVVGAGLALLIVDTFLNTEFEGGRHQVRVDKIEKNFKS